MLNARALHTGRKVPAGHMHLGERPGVPCAERGAAFGKEGPGRVGQARTGFKLLPALRRFEFERGDLEGSLPELVDDVAAKQAAAFGKQGHRRNQVPLVCRGGRPVSMRDMPDPIKDALPGSGGPAVDGAEMRGVSGGPLGVLAQAFDGSGIRPGVPLNDRQAVGLVRQKIVREDAGPPATAAASDQGDGHPLLASMPRAFKYNDAAAHPSVGEA